jgi:catechol 2,3-dioxygenase-like lactoylglutathione lyase family enzyme
MGQSLTCAALVARNYDGAIAFYCDKLGFVLIEDGLVEAPKKRWVVAAPPGPSSTRPLFARPVGDHQASRIGDQSGGFFRAPSEERTVQLYSCCIHRSIRQPLGSGGAEDPNVTGGVPD